MENTRPIMLLISCRSLENMSMSFLYNLMIFKETRQGTLKKSIHQDTPCLFSWLYHASILYLDRRCRFNEQTSTQASQCTWFDVDLPIHEIGFSRKKRLTLLRRKKSCIVATVTLSVPQSAQTIVGQPGQWGSQASSWQAIALSQN